MTTSRPQIIKRDVQGVAIAQTAAGLLARSGWVVIEQEQEYRDRRDVGHLDLLAWHGEAKQLAVIDLKTGRNVGAGWLQVGGYLSLHGYQDPIGRTLVPNGGILHIPRQRVDRPVSGRLEIRNGKDLRELWLRRRERIERVLDGEAPMPTPGLHCGRCGVSGCMARAEVAL